MYIFSVCDISELISLLSKITGLYNKIIYDSII